MLPVFVFWRLDMFVKSEFKKINTSSDCSSISALKKN